jgi:hypothetical protein
MFHYTFGKTFKEILLDKDAVKNDVILTYYAIEQYIKTIS